MCEKIKLWICVICSFARIGLNAENANHQKPPHRAQSKKINSNKPNKNSSNNLNKKAPTGPKVPSFWLEKISANFPLAPAQEIVESISELVGTKVNLLNVSNVEIEYVGNDVRFIDFIKSICALADWRLIISDNGDITLAKNEEYEETYHLSIPMQSNKIQAIQKMRHASNANDSLVTTTDSGLNLWEEVESNLKFILGDVGAYTTVKQAGLVIVRGTQKQHKAVARLIDELKEGAFSQVLLDIQMLLVRTNKFKAGVVLDLPNLLKNSTRLSTLDSLFSGNQVDTLASMVRALTIIKTLGKIQKRWSNSIRCINNNWGHLQLVRNEVSYRLKSSPYAAGQKNASNPNFTVFESTPEIIPVGVSLAFCPTILDDKILLQILPSVSSIKEHKTDPTFALMNKQSQQGFPVIEGRSAHNIMHVKDGETVSALIVTLTKDEAIQLGINNGSIDFNNYSDDDEFQFIVLVGCKIQKNNRGMIKKLSDYELRSVPLGMVA